MKAAMQLQSIPSLRLQRGLSLIEVVVALVILVVLLAAGTQLTSTWVHNSQTQDARTKLAWGYEQAKAMALRNPCRAEGQEAAAHLVAVQKDDTVELYLQAGIVGGNASTCDFLLRNPAPQWRAYLPAGVVLSINDKSLAAGSAPLVMQIDSRGAPLNAPYFSYRLRKGSDTSDETGLLQ